MTEYLLWLDHILLNGTVVDEYGQKSFELIDLDTISESDATIKIFSVMYFGLYCLVLAPLFMICAPIFFIFYWFPSIAEWIVIKTKTNSMMKLIIFKNGKPIFQKRSKKS